MIVKNVPNNVAGVILAGGLASRMGGGDKTLKTLGKKTILEHVIDRLSSQVTNVALNANGDPNRFAKFNMPVIQDQTDQFLGPLAGILAGLEWAHENEFSHIVTVAADTPFFPLTLVKTLSDVLITSGSQIALAVTKEKGSEKIIRHPTFGLWPVNLRDDLRTSIYSGVRKVIRWSENHKSTDVFFDSERGDPFFNVNTYRDLSTAQTIVNLEAE